MIIQILNLGRKLMELEQVYLCIFVSWERKNCFLLSILLV